jgi:hypothetical protein
MTNSAIQNLWYAYNIAYYGGPALMVCAFWPFGQGHRRWVRYPWFLVCGIVVLIISLVLGAIYGIAIS